MHFIGLRAASIALVLLATANPARAGERDQLNACKALVEHTTKSTTESREAGTAADAAKLQQCRQMIKEWSLRDSRMSVDENGRPLK